MKRKPFRIVSQKEYDAEIAAEKKTERFLRRRKLHEEKIAKEKIQAEQSVREVTWPN